MKRLTCTLAALAMVVGTWVLSKAEFAGALRGGEPTLLGVRNSVSNSRLPFTFVPNAGQMDQRVRYSARTAGATFSFTSGGAVFAFTKGEKGHAIQLTFTGANPAAEPIGARRGTGTVNYLIGSDASRWHTGLPTYGEIIYRELWPGIDLAFRGENGELKYEFRVAPGADPERIRLAYRGVRRLSIDGDGDLRIHTALGIIEDSRPVSYQEVDGARVAVASRYKLAGKSYGFATGDYDRSRPLVIDPGLDYSTYIGGSEYDQVTGVAVDGAGSVYLTGGTCSTDFPTGNPWKPQLGNGCNAFVAKLSPDGTSLVYSTYLGGTNPSANDAGNAIAIDAAGNAYVTGETGSTDFPTVNPVQASLAPSPGGGSGWDAFVAMLSPAGDALVYSTYLGGPCGDAGTGIAVDAAGNAYVTGQTGGVKPTGQICRAAGFPTVNALQPTHAGLSEAFLAKLPPSGRPLVYSTYIGGSGNDVARGVALDSSSNVYVGGHTESNNFPTLDPVQACEMGGPDAFVTKVSASGTALAYSTCLGGTNQDHGIGIAVDGTGSAYITGQTNSTDFPQVSPLQGSYGGLHDAFVTRLSPSGRSLVFSSYLGGSSLDAGYAIDLDAAGSIYVGGHTISPNFPLRDAVQSSKSAGYDGFVAKISQRSREGASTVCGALVYSTYLGGSDPLASTSLPSEDWVFGIAVDPAGHAYVVGATSATNFPIANAFQPAKGGKLDGFVSRFDLGPDPPVEPIARAGANLSVAEGMALILDGSASTDPDCDPLFYHWEQIAGPAVTLSDPTVASPGFTAPSVTSGGATLTFQLVVDDGVHYSAPATVTVTITNVNQEPVPRAGPDQTVQPGSTVTLDCSASLDPDADPIQCVWSQTAGVAVSLSNPYASNPTFTAPAAGETLAFTVVALDPVTLQWYFDEGYLPATDVVQVFVTSANQAPIARAGSDQTADEGAVVTLQGLASSDPDGNAVSYDWTQISGPAVVLSDPSAATPAFAAPAVGAGGATLVFQLVVSDGSAQSAPDTVDITVRNVNQPPVGNSGSATTGEDTMVQITLAASDPDGDAVTYAIADAPAHGTVTLSGGVATYTPAPDYNGADTFSFRASDGTYNSNVATVSINVWPINDKPTARDDFATTAEDTSVTISVLSNDSDVDGDAPALASVAQPAHGLAVINPDGTLAYTPAPNFFGADSFSYIINDGYGGTTTATVNVTVSPINDPPTALNGAALIEEDTQVEIMLAAADVDSGTLNLALVSQPANGTLSAIEGGKVLYTPNPNYNGPDGFTFVANDGTADSNVATIMITVAPVADVPILATVGNQLIAEGAPLSFALSASDPDGGQLTFSASGLPSGATLDPTTGSFSWTPSYDQAGIYTLTFSVTDATGRLASETITITVSDVGSNLGPVCSAAYPSINEIWPPNHQPRLVSVLGVTDPDNDPLSITIRRIVQDEPTNTQGDGNTSIDGGGLGTSQAWVRAERSGTKKVSVNGRVYEIFFDAADGRGKSCTGSIKVGVPHDQGHGPAVDDGKRYDSTVAGGPCLNCNH